MWRLEIEPPPPPPALFPMGNQLDAVTASDAHAAADARCGYTLRMEITAKGPVLDRQSFV